MPDSNPDDGKGPNIGGTPSGGSTNTPNPDPTVLTTAALYREVAALKELIEQRITSVSASADQRFDLLDARLDRTFQQRTDLDAETQKRTDLQFSLVEQQRVEQKADTKAAVDAALTAQKEAIQKAETGTTKQIEQLQNAFGTEVAALRRSIDENKERIVETERGLGARIGEVATTANAYGQQKQGSLDTRSLVFGLIGVAGVIVAAIAFLTR